MTQIFWIHLRWEDTRSIFETRRRDLAKYRGISSVDSHPTQISLLQADYFSWDACHSPYLTTSDRDNNKNISGSILVKHFEDSTWSCHMSEKIQIEAFESLWNFEKWYATF